MKQTSITPLRLERIPGFEDWVLFCSRGQMRFVLSSSRKYNPSESLSYNIESGRLAG